MMLSPETLAVLKDNMPLAIAQKQLSSAHLQHIYAQRWFSLWVPTDLGGLSASLPEGCRLLEELAYEDGGVAWCITLCSGANMFAGFVDPEVAQQIFADPAVCWGGSGRPGGRAVREGEGYRLSGMWKYATGAPHLTHFTANCLLYKDGEPSLDENGQQAYITVFIPRDQVLVHYDWDTFGLEATASHSFSVQDIWVADQHTFQLNPNARYVDSPLFKLPFNSFAAFTLAVNYMGMFRKYCALFERMLFLKSHDAQWYSARGKGYYAQLTEIQERFAAQRSEVYTLLSQSWDIVQQQEQHELPDPLLRCQELVAYIRQQTVLLFPAFGIQGAQRDEEVNIVFRNLFTATQHNFLNI